jgi:hypothetical protein
MVAFGENGTSRAPASGEALTKYGGAVASTLDADDGTTKLDANAQSAIAAGQSGHTYRGTGTWFPAASRAAVVTIARYVLPGAKPVAGWPTVSSVADESHRNVSVARHPPPTSHSCTAGLVAVMFIGLLNSRVIG